MASAGLAGLLVAVVKLLASTATSVTALGEKRARQKAILSLLVIYFYLLDVAEDGRALLDSVGSNPTRTLRMLSREAAESTAIGWHKIICRQTMRLDALARGLIAEDALAIVNPELKTQLERTIGTKASRARSLSGIGAALVIHAMFIGGDDREALLSVVESMYPNRGRDLLDLPQAHRELRALERALDEYRRVCNDLASKSEIVALAKRARRNTTFRERSRRKKLNDDGARGKQRDPNRGATQ